MPRSPAEFDAWYQQQIQEIKPTDSDRLYRLAMTCWTNKHPSQAADACRRILAAWPDHAKAKSLLRLTSRYQAASRPAGTPAAGQLATARPAATQPALLSAETINRLRFAEFCYKDMSDRPHVTISHAVIQEFLAEMDKTGAMTEQEKAQFQQSDNDDKLRWIVLHTGMRFADRIQVNTEPRSLATYRQKVWPIISRSCAMPACHGGQDAGDLRLILSATPPAVGVTNFYLLNTFEGADGQLVDREHPEASLLLQYGLVPDQAEMKHPVPIKPLYLGTNDAKYRVVLDWIRALRTPAPQYRVSQTARQPLAAVQPSIAAGSTVDHPVVGKPATQPAGH